MLRQNLTLNHSDEMLILPMIQIEMLIEDDRCSVLKRRTFTCHRMGRSTACVVQKSNYTMNHFLISLLYGILMSQDHICLSSARVLLVIWKNYRIYIKVFYWMSRLYYHRYEPEPWMRLMFMLGQKRNKKLFITITLKALNSS